MKTTLILMLVIVAFGCTTHKKPATGNEQTGYYTEKYRPQFHFSPPKGWMNDPNGMVYYAGEYHLFFQHTPHAATPDFPKMHWGHAVSTDLVHWKELPPAIAPDEYGAIFSGSAVVDWNNTAGLQSGDEKTLVAIFTYSPPNGVQSQGMAYSNDKGRTWVKHKNNPILQNQGIADFRDAKVFWYEKGQKWMMTLAVKDHVGLYSSPNLLDWTFESNFGAGTGAHGGVWECPDLFPLKVNGGDQTKWVMIVNINPGGPNGGSGVQYFVGDFDGHAFTATSKETGWLDYGRDNYAGVTWSDVPVEDGRRLFMGWMSNWDYASIVPTTVWRGAMTLPRELKLEEADGRFRVTSVPVSELNQLRDQAGKITFATEQISGEKQLETNNINLNQCELILNLETGENIADSLGLILENSLGEFVKIGYSAKSKQLFVDRTKSGNMSFSDRFTGIDYAPYEIWKQLQLHLYVDAASVELFVDGGKLVMTDCFFATEIFTKLSLFADNGEIKLKGGSITKMKSIWGN